MRWSTSKLLDRYAHPDYADALDAIQTMNKKPPEETAPSQNTGGE